MWKTAALLAFLMGSSAHADTASDYLSPYLLNEAIAYEAKSAYTKDKRTFVKDLVARSSAFDAGIGAIEISLTETGTKSFYIDAMNVLGKAPGSPQFRLNGVSVELERDPDRSLSSGVCAYSDIIRVLKIEQAEFLFPEQSGFGVESIKVKNLGYELRGENIPSCHLSGLLSFDLLELDYTDKSSSTFEMIRSQIRMPLNPEYSGNENSNPGIRMDIGEFEFRNGAEFPAYGFTDLKVSADFSDDGVTEMVSALSSARFFDAKRDPQTLIIDLVNALSEANGKVSVSTEKVRILTPGVVPPEAIANFSRVGLSTVYGALRSDVVLRNGAIGVDFGGNLNGILETDFKGTFLLKPYIPEKRDLSLSGKTLGVHLTPDLSIVEMQMGYTDRGLEHYVLDLTGIPAGRNIEEFGGMMVASSTDAMRRTVEVAIRELSSFFRFAGDGMIMRIFSEPERPVSIPEILLTALSDVEGLDTLLGLTMVANTPTE